MGKMCGLCGNFDGKKTNEFLSEDGRWRWGPGPSGQPRGADLAPPVPPGKLLEPHKYAALQKLDDPNEICAYEAIPSPQVLQAEHVREAGMPSGSWEPSSHSGVSHGLR